MTSASETASREESPLVSIVVPAYNHGRYLSEAIDSILAQDYPYIEVTVVDDGSTDNTREILGRYSPRVTTIAQQNMGQAATIRREWQRARGAILSYLSADDRLEPHAVSAAVRALESQRDAVMVYGDYELIDPRSATIRHVSAPPFDYGEMVGQLICAPGPGVFVRRDAADKIDGWDPEFRQAPDFEYWLRLGLLGRFHRLPVVLAGLRVHPGSASYAVADQQRADEPVRIMEKYFGRSDIPSDVRALERVGLSSAHLLAARAHLRAGRVRDTRRNIVAAVSLCPANLFTVRAARLLANAVFNRAGHSLLWRLRSFRRQDAS